MAGKTLSSAADSENCIGVDSSETADAASKTSSCRSLVPSSPRSIALYPSAAYRNLHPSASTHHLQASSTFFSDSHQRALYNARMINTLQSGAAGYDQLQFPVTFQRLQSNTDLRLGPSSSSASFSHPSMHRPHFSSFQMAHEFLECVRGVDVISDAENIKQLLKMPFDPQAEVSLIVHRIENTLLLDPFSVTQLEQHRTDWAWLQRFQAHVFQRFINRDHCSAVTKLRSETQQRNRQLLLHIVQCTIQAAQQTHLACKGAHDTASVEVASLASPSVCAAPPPGEAAGRNKSEGGPRSDACVSPSTAVIPLNLTPAVPCHAEAVCAEEEVMPEPDASDQTPDTCYGDAHARKIIWNFEDVRMLIGTDLPIFGGDSHPCVSLRLHDMAKPITVLTGLDHWLDNLMCNVPEVAMCFHLSGIVQKYEMIKTEELPELTDCQFSPALVKDIAQNILAFLKVNTSEEGHTYWLFKKENDDVVKLYDLTNLKLGDEAPDEPAAAAPSAPDPDASPDHGANLNPFTVPAGMLFYRVAKSLLQDPDTRRRAATVTDLLHNAIKILHARRYPEIVSSAHFYIAEVLMAEDYREHEERDTDSSADDYDSEPLPRETGSKKSSSNNNKKSKKGKGPSAHPHQTHARQSWDARSGRRPSDAPLRFINLPQLCLSSTRQTFSRRSRRYRPPRLTQNFSARCTSALSHVAQGLQCILAKEKSNESKSRCPEGLQDPESSPSPEEEPKMARKNESIPLPYESIHVALQRNSQASDSIQEQSSTTSTQESPTLPDDQKASNISCISANLSPTIPARAGVREDTSDGKVDALHARDPVCGDANDGNDRVSPKRDSNDRGTIEGLQRSSKSTKVERSSSRARSASTGGPGAVVPSSECLWVQLSSVRYGVSSLTAKLKLLLLHQAAVGYKIIASDAFHSKQFSKAADNVDFCVRCCVAVSHLLQRDCSHPCEQIYPLMKEVLGLASEIFYEWAKAWDQSCAPVKTSKKTSKKSSKEHPETRASGACEYNCTAAADGGDVSSDDEGLSEMTNGKMMVILERLVPHDYRAQFEMPVSPSSAYACMMLSQCYLFLEAGGRLNATSVLHAAPRHTGDGGNRIPLVDLTPGCSLRLSFKDEMVRRSPDIVARLADVMNEMACFQINMVQNACMRGADERQCALLLDALAADKEHLMTAVSLFVKLGDTDNAAISLANLAKYHRLCAYFSPSRMNDAPMAEQEAQHHVQAAASYRQAVWYIEQHIQGGAQAKTGACKVPDAKPPKRRNVLNKEAGDKGLAPKKSLKSNRKPDSVSADGAECDTDHLQAEGSEGRVLYEPRQLNIVQAKDLSEKLKMDLVRTFTAHADGIRKRGLSEAEAGEANAVELLCESVSVMRSVLAQSPSYDCCVLLASNSLRIFALRSGLCRDSECVSAEWLPALQGLQTALFSRQHHTTALLCTTSAIFSLLASHAGSTGECIRACVTCLVQSCYVVASHISSPASDVPLVMEDGRRFELTLLDFGLLRPCQEALDWRVSPQAAFGVEERDTGAGISATQDKETTPAASGASNLTDGSINNKNSSSNGGNSKSNDSKSKKGNAKDIAGGSRKDSKKSNIVQAKESLATKSKTNESCKNTNNATDNGNKTKKANNKRNKKGDYQKQNSEEEARNGDQSDHNKSVEKTKHDLSAVGNGKRSQPSGGGEACARKESCRNPANQKTAEKAKEDCGGARWNAALLLEVERCLRTALQRFCQLSKRSPHGSVAGWRGSDAMAAYRATLLSEADGCVADRLMTALADVQALLAIPAAPADALLA